MDTRIHEARTAKIDENTFEEKKHYLGFQSRILGFQTSFTNQKVYQNIIAFIKCAL